LQFLAGALALWMKFIYKVVNWTTYMPYPPEETRYNP
jgi:hypothetical protein